MSYAREEAGVDDRGGCWHLHSSILQHQHTGWQNSILIIHSNTDSKAFNSGHGLLIASFPPIYWHAENEKITNLLLNKWFLYAVIAVLSWLMVSNIPDAGHEIQKFLRKSNLPKFITLLIIALLAAIFLHWVAVPVVFVAYIILSLVFKINKHDIHSTGKSYAAQRPA